MGDGRAWDDRFKSNGDRVGMKSEGLGASPFSITVSSRPGQQSSFPFFFEILILSARSICKSLTTLVLRRNVTFRDYVFGDCGILSLEVRHQYFFESAEV